MAQGHPCIRFGGRRGNCKQLAQPNLRCCREARPGRGVGCVCKIYGAGYERGAGTRGHGEGLCTGGRPFIPRWRSFRLGDVRYIRGAGKGRVGGKHPVDGSAGHPARRGAGCDRPRTGTGQRSGLRPRGSLAGRSDARRRADTKGRGRCAARVRPGAAGRRRERAERR